MDPRRWDLQQLLAAYESTVKQGAKDESAWRRFHGQIYAEPKEVKRDRLAAERQAAQQGRQTAAERPTAAAMTLDSVEALLASAAAAEARFNG